MKINDVAEILDKIEKQYGLLTPPAVVKEAEDENSPLHGYFEWDDEIAGQAFRINQARALIREVKVEFFGQEVSAYQNVKVYINEVASRGYINTPKVMADRGLRQQVIEEALHKLEHWQETYKDLTEIAEVIDQSALNKVKENLKGGE